jgi:hypothetical protein
VPTLIDTVWGCGYILRDPSSTPVNAAQDNAAGSASLWPEGAQMSVAA